VGPGERGERERDEEREREREREGERERSQRCFQYELTRFRPTTI
jgi:hypothetical protein